MTALQGNQLTLRATDRRHLHAQFRLERALARATLPSGRIYAVNRLPPLRFTAARGRFDEERTEGFLRSKLERELTPILAGAVHGTVASASQANAVWFADLAEAQAAYIALAARGQATGAWFWRSLLGPEWRLPHPPAAIRGQFDRLFADAAEVAVLRRTFALAVQQAGLVAVARLLAGPGRGARVPAEAAEVHDPQAGTASSGNTTPLARVAGQELSATVAQLVHGLSTLAEVRALLAPAGTRPFSISSVLRVAVRLQLAMERPDLLAERRLAVQIETAVVSTLIAMAGQPPDRRQPFLAPPYEPSQAPASGDRVPRRADRPTGLVAETPDLSEHATAETTHPQTSELAGEAADILGETCEPMPGAGLLLVIPSLVQIGLADWLHQRAEWQLQRFAHRLLLALSLHYRPAGAEQMARLLGLGRDIPHGPPTAAWASDERAWRIGLDRWLRRRCDLRLHDLAQLDAPVSQANEAWRCHFTMAQICMGLRRAALDRDPGWTPWLGLSLRYEFTASEAEEMRP